MCAVCGYNSPNPAFEEREMKNMEKNHLRLAVLAALALQPGVGEAVNVSPDGQGQVLLFPYYTVRGGYSTLMSVTNTQDFAKD